MAGLAWRGEVLPWSIIAAIEKNERHPSILKIRKHIRAENYFDFKHIDDKKMAEVL